MSNEYDKEFLTLVESIRSNNTMNMYVSEKIDNNAPIPELIKEIKKAIKMHRKYNLQFGSSPIHAAVVMSMNSLLIELTKGIQK